jgi:hypothetical protein
MAYYKEFEWYNLFHIEPDGVIKYLHYQNVTFDNQNLNLFMVEVDSLPLWGAQFEYGVKEKAKLYHLAKLYHVDCITFREMLEKCVMQRHWDIIGLMERRILLILGTLDSHC